MYIKIDKYLIKVGFKINKKDEKELKSAKIFKEFLRKRLNSFIEKRKLKDSKIHYSILFTNDNSFKIILQDNQNSFYKKIFKDDVNNKIIITNYNISYQEINDIFLYLFNKLTSDKGLIIHCSAIKTNSGIIIFLGESGSGKSFLAKALSSKYNALADDFGLLLLRNNKLYFHQLPFSDEYIKEKKSNRINKFFLLKKSKKFKIVKIKEKTHIIKNIINQNIFFNIKNYDSEKIKLITRIVSVFDDFYYFYFNFNKNKVINYISKLVPSIFIILFSNSLIFFSNNNLCSFSSLIA